MFSFLLSWVDICCFQFIILDSRTLNLSKKKKICSGRADPRYLLCPGNCRTVSIWASRVFTLFSSKQLVWPHLLFPSEFLLKLIGYCWLFVWLLKNVLTRELLFGSKCIKKECHFLSLYKYVSGNLCYWSKQASFPCYEQIGAGGWEFPFCGAWLIWLLEGIRFLSHPRPAWVTKPAEAQFPKPYCSY